MNRDNFLHREWSYMAGGIALALANTVFLFFNNKPWGITTPITRLSAKIAHLFGADISQWSAHDGNTRYAELMNGWYLEMDLVIIIGFFLGVIISSVAASEFRWKKIRSSKQIALALAGGFIMGYGARLASGCNIGAFMGSMPSLSLHGWIFGITAFVGVYFAVRVMYMR